MNVNVSYCMFFLLFRSAIFAPLVRRRPVTDLNCVTNISLKVIIQLGQQGIQQIIVDEGKQHVLV